MTETPSGTNAAGPLELGQWVLHGLTDETRAYNILRAYRLSGPLDRLRLCAALAALSKRHPALRRRFILSGGTLLRQDTSPQATSIRTVDISALPTSYRSAATDRLLEWIAGTAFDLTRGPLFFAVVIACSEDDHVLALAGHHIVVDGISLSVLIDDLRALYAGHELPPVGTEPPAEDTSPAVKEALERQMPLLRQAERLELPGIGIPAHAGQAGLTNLQIGAERLDELGWLAKGCDATLFTVLLAGWQILLYRLSRRRNLVVGVPFANRIRVEAERTVGLFANMVPVAIRLDPSWSTIRLISALRPQTLDAMVLQGLPYDRILRQTFPGNRNGRAALIQTTFTLLHEAVTLLDLPDIHAVSLEVAMPAAKYELALEAVVGPAGLHVSLEYDRGRFLPNDAETMLRQYAILLDAMAAAPDWPLGVLPLGNAPVHPPQIAIPLEPNDSLSARFSRQTRLSPDAVAVADGEAQFTYHHLDGLSDALAARLRTAGIVPEDCIALCGERSPALIVGMLGILKAGAAYVPVDPDHPAARRAQILAEAAPAAILDTRAPPIRQAAPLEPNGIPCLVLNLAALHPSPDAPPAPQVRAGMLAYVIYTSGSTGQPKGAMLTHANFLHLLDATMAGFAFCVGDRWLLFHSYAFDFSVWEIFGALLTGARLEIVPTAILKEADGFHRFAARRAVTVLNQTPSAFAALDRADASACCPGPTPRLIVLGGEALPAALVARWQARRGDRSGRIVNMYGITETTVHVTETPSRPDRPTRGGSWIGRPVRGVTTYVLDPMLRPLPSGPVGEVYVAGTGLARGYLNRPGQTAERFLPDPFVPRPGERMYRTGDLARYEPDGTLTYIGRADDQISLRGYRIEPAEIETCLARHPAIAEAMVCVRAAADGTETLAAYIVSRQSLPTAEELRVFAAAQLPAYMVPPSFAAVDRLPRTVNGKLDRKTQLDAPPLPEHATAKAGVGSELETLVGTIWQSVLGTGTVGPDDHFFALGGHSLLVPAVADRLREAIGQPIPLAVIFEEPQLSRFCARLAARLRGAPEPPTAGLKQGADRDAYPLSREQRQLLAAHVLDPAGGAALTLTEAHLLAGFLPPDRMAAAVAAVAQHHAALRTRIEDRPSWPLQVIAPHPAPFSHVDLSALPADRQAREVRRLVDGAVIRRLDPGGALWSAHLLRCRPNRHVLILQAHHAAADAHSLTLVDEALGATWRGLQLPAPAPRYADYALAQVAPSRSEAPPALPLPADTRGSRRTERRLEGELAVALRGVTQGQNATPFMIFAAATAAALLRRTGCGRLHLGFPISTRTQPEHHGIVGPMVERAVLALDIDPRQSFATLIAQTRREVMAAVLENKSSTAQPDAMIAQEQAPARLSLAGLASRRLRARPPHLLYPLTLIYRDTPPSVAALYRPNAGPPQAVGALVDEIVAVLQGIANDATAPIVGIGAEVAGADPHRLSVDFNL